MKIRVQKPAIRSKISKFREIWSKNGAVILDKGAEGTYKG
jgi:hypothetical protein